MTVMQNKIQEIEGAVAGDSLSWDSDEIPAEIANQLPSSTRRPVRPRAFFARIELMLNARWRLGGGESNVSKDFDCAKVF
jgi:hypothetical protein